MEGGVSFVYPHHIYMFWLRNKEGGEAYCACSMCGRMLDLLPSLQKIQMEVEPTVLSVGVKGGGAYCV